MKQYKILSTTQIIPQAEMVAPNSMRYKLAFPVYPMASYIPTGTGAAKPMQSTLVAYLDYMSKSKDIGRPNGPMDPLAKHPAFLIQFVYEIGETFALTYDIFRPNSKKMMDAMDELDGQVILCDSRHFWICHEDDARALGAKTYEEWN